MAELSDHSSTTMSVSGDEDSTENIMADSNAPSTDSPLTLESSSTETTKKHKASPTSSTNTKIDFSFAKDQILPKVPDEDIRDIGSYTWEIKEYKRLLEDKVRGPVFTVGGYDFNVLLFPKGNTNNNLAIYLEPQPKKHLDEATGEMVYDDPNWYVCAQFTIIVSNVNDPRNCVISTSQQRFSKHATDWGFSNFMEMKFLYTNRKDGHALLSDDKLKITVYVKVLNDTTGVLWHNFLDYDSKKESGFVGFKNQGATCYLNSLMQSYFLTKSFRRAVYQIPTESESPTNSVALALQRMFYGLQRSDEALDTTELTKSFGWDNADAFTQHDVQELNRILMDKLESKMKGTPVENMLNDTFVGKMKSYIRCVNVDYESSRIEDFWDIQLNVKGLSNLIDSFQNYIEVEMMDGENQYDAQGYGHQDAKKGVIFTEFPNVLHLQLKRFEYDFNQDTLTKVNDRYEFPETIDLSPYLERADGTDAEPYVYDLHGVLVHAGDFHNGHYYAMIKPGKEDKWYRFDDDKVWRVTKSEVFEQNFGMTQVTQAEMMAMSRQKQQEYYIRRHTSAYMLVYIKRTEVDNILQEVTEDDVPKHVSESVIKELEDRVRERKEREELHLYLSLELFTDALFKSYEGFDLAADERHSQPGLYSQEFYPSKVKALKTSKFKDLFPAIEEATGVDPENVNFWSMTYRRNQTLRVKEKLISIGELTVEEVYRKFFSKRHTVMPIWLEDASKELFENTPSGLKPIEKIDVDQDENLIESTKILLFLKYFDEAEQSLKGVTHLYVNEDDTVDTIIPAVKNALNISDEYDLDLFEEISNGSIEKLLHNVTFHKCELTNGDIITAQKSSTKNGDLLSGAPADAIFKYTSADKYYTYLGTRRHINIQPLTSHNRDDEFVAVDAVLENEDNSSFDMWITYHATYDEFAARIAQKIKRDPAYLRVYVNYSGNRTLMRSGLTVGNLMPKTLFQNVTPLFEYELLTVPFTELEQMIAVKIRWLPSGYCHFTDHDILLKRDSKIKDIIEKLQTKIGFSDEDKKSVLLWENNDSMFTQLLTNDSEASDMDEQDEVFGAILPEESAILEKYYYSDEELTERKVLLTPVLQFHRDPRQTHGISFIFPLYNDEPLGSARSRMHKKLGLGQKEFAKVKFCVWNPRESKARYLTDDNIILSEHVASEDYLCLDLPARTSRVGNPHAAGISIR